MKPKIFDLPEPERQKAIGVLLEESVPDADFFVLLVLSSFIVVPGLLINNAAIIIGGMVVAPLLFPILGISMGISQANFHLIFRCLRTMLLAVGLVFLGALLMALFSPDRIVNAEIEARATVSFAHSVVAIASGVAAAFALVKPKISATVTGIAVSVSLLPPLATAGIGASMLDWRLVSGSIGLFLVNCLGIILAATVIFSLLGFYPERKQTERKLKTEEQA
ncbi:TIGR00341 family protein [Candidatus Uhrbacteria bacterium RIFOXYB12_FULL_58_10]|uniref:TIGR00341 family protein n=1 Tax=Candidatus Uhrbacteria bacterium RIFOXYB2_FULL_57_15 TaxID=1802422 RepID=A0A1F7W8K9_9BACT|nr:MAG: TIGR00341 family protein [Candidatus Uhrbacteria bacterium RIFOXYB12_FULL_58_10]OGL99110.1 MAG: TIGR00341 family protein [Candidatus Uhrbacteria bacterium RIFOXYB2_FULL_57_15]OGL99601.1 MAG: TIGR00341 family protein [Candidatus Uhrbacteria bacterium RIFOXYC12_FULL_57_11]